MPIGDSDFNQDGASQAGELFTLGSQNITGIHVASTEVNQLLPDGNLFNRTGTFTRGDGSTGVSGETSANFFFAQDTFNRQFTDPIPFAVGVSALPDMQGSGKVRDLREAASQSPALLSALSQYSQATTRQAQRAQLDQLLDAWADTSGLISSSDSKSPRLTRDACWTLSRRTSGTRSTMRKRLMIGYLPDPFQKTTNNRYRETRNDRIKSFAGKKLNARLKLDDFPGRAR